MAFQNSSMSFTAKTCTIFLFLTSEFLTGQDLTTKLSMMDMRKMFSLKSVMVLLERTLLEKCGQMTLSTLTLEVKILRIGGRATFLNYKIKFTSMVSGLT